MPLKSGPKIPVGTVLLSSTDLDPRQLDMTKAERDAIIPTSRIARLPDMDEYEFITRGYLARVMDSNQLGEAMGATYFETCPDQQKTKMLAQKTPTPQYIVQVDRELLRAVGVQADIWGWILSTEQDGWVRTPLTGAKTTEEYMTAGWETRYIPIHSQTLPCITDACSRGYKTVPETRAGWVDSWMCRAKSALRPNPTGCYAFCQLEDWGKTTTISDPIRDGNLYAYVLEVQVVRERLATDLMAHSLGGIFYQEAIEINALLTRAAPFYSLTSGQDLLSKGTDIEIFPQSLWDKRHMLNSEQTAQRLDRPPKLGRLEPGGGRDAFERARTMFNELWSRIISLDVVRRTTDVIIEGKPHLQIGHPASCIVMPPADVDVGQGEITSSVIPQVPPMEAGAGQVTSTVIPQVSPIEAGAGEVTSSVVPQVPPMEAVAVSIGPATDTFHIEKPRSDDTIDKPATGDRACECGKWRAPSQNRCECGRATSTFVGDASDATALIKRSGPDVVATPAPQSWAEATPWTSQGAETAASQGQWGLLRRFYPKPSKTPAQPAASAVMGVLEQSSANVYDQSYRRISRINHQQLVRNEFDATFFGNVGDLVCPCGLWRPPMRNLCQCGQIMRTPIAPDKIPLAGIRGHIENATQALVMEIMSGDHTVGLQVD
jgi:hypothetical protein